MTQTVRSMSPYILILAIMIDDTILSHSNVSSHFKLSKTCASMAACSEEQLPKHASMTLLLLFNNIGVADAANNRYIG